MQKFFFFFFKCMDVMVLMLENSLRLDMYFLIQWATHIIVRIFLHNIGIHLSRCNYGYLLHLDDSFNRGDF